MENYLASMQRVKDANNTKTSCFDSGHYLLTCLDTRHTHVKDRKNENVPAVLADKASKSTPEDKKLEINRLSESLNRLIVGIAGG